MNILPVNICYPLQYNCIKQVNPVFKNKPDELHISYVKELEKSSSGLIKSIRYKYPISVANVFKNMAYNQDPFMQARFLAHLHSPEEVKEISSLLDKNPEIGNIKVKSLIGLGVFAYVFETEDGFALKITEGPHFKDNRPPADFDFPILKSGKLAKNNIYYYFFEEIAKQDNLKASEILDLIKSIKSQGYEMRDYTLWGGGLNYKQFGRASDGKVYLLDPGCAIANNTNVANVANVAKKGIVNKILNLIKKRTF